MLRACASWPISFSSTLQTITEIHYVHTQLRFGTLNDDLTKALHELTQKCGDTNKAGSLTLVIKLKPGSGGQMEVFDDIKLVLPKEPKGSSIMFATVDGNLQREDPRQRTLDGLKTVGQVHQELRTVGASAGETIDQATGEITGLSKVG